MITNFFDVQKNKKIDYNKNNKNKLNDETKIQIQKQIKLGESLEQEIHITAEKKREQYIKYLIDKIKTAEVELKHSTQKNNDNQEKLKALQFHDDIIDTLKTKLINLDTEKNNYKKKSEQSEKQLQQVVIEKNKYMEQSEKQLQQVVKENNTYKESLLKNENIIIYNNPIINIPTIHIIYQYTYKNNVSVTGLGDFIRCCFYILQFSDNYSINIDFNIYKHPIKKYFKYFLNKEDISESISNNISFFEKKNYKYFTNNNIIDYYYYNIDNDIFKFIKQIETYDKHKYLYLVNHPDETRILEQHKIKIRELFEPVYELQMKIDDMLTSLNLIKYKYKIIQIRLNDDSFKGGYINFTDKQTISMNSTVLAKAATAHDNMQPYIVLNYIIKY